MVCFGTHNHPEGIKGAEATASIIWMARNKASKKEIKEYIYRKNFYMIYLEAAMILDRIMSLNLYLLPQTKMMNALDMHFVS